MYQNHIDVDGLRLPKYLVKLINQNRWPDTVEANRLKKVVGYSGNTAFDFLTPENMIRVNQLPHLFDSPDIAYRFGHASSQKSGQPVTDLTILDIDLAVMIAMNWDEEAICLDYRSDMKDPSVVFSQWVNDHTVWRTVTANIEDFAQLLDL